MSEREKIGVHQTHAEPSEDSETTEAGQVDPRINRPKS